MNRRTYMLERAGAYYGLAEHLARAHAYCKGRGIGEEVAFDYRAGYAPPGWRNLCSAMNDADVQAGIDVGLFGRTQGGRVYDRLRDRVTLPILDERGNFVAIAGRTCAGEEPKYLTTSASDVFLKGATLFGWPNASAPMRRAGRVVVVEGQFDVLALVAAGIGETVGTMGTATTLAHVALLERVPLVILCFDGDDAGRQAARAAADLVVRSRTRTDVRVATLPDGTDPDSFVRWSGVAALEAVLGAAVPVVPFLVDAILAEHGARPTNIGRLVMDIRDVLRGTQDKAVAEAAVATVARRLEMTQAWARQWLALPRARPTLEVRR